MIIVWTIYVFKEIDKLVGLGAVKSKFVFSQEWSTWYKLRKWKKCTGESVWPKCPKFKKQHIEKMKNSEQKWEHLGEVMTKQWRPSAGNTFQWSSGTLQVLSILSPLNQTLALTGGTNQSSLSENTTQKKTHHTFQIHNPRIQIKLKKWTRLC